VPGQTSRGEAQIEDIAERSAFFNWKAQIRLIWQATIVSLPTGHPHMSM
jgi:hypothetical protein